MYDRLPTDVEDPLGSLSATQQTRGSSWTERIHGLTLQAIPVLIAAIGCYLLGRASIGVEDCGRRLSTWSPALKAIEYHQVTWDGAFRAPSIFRGTPTPELDAAWESISTGGEGIFRITKADLSRLNKSEKADTVLGFQDGTDDAQVLLEVFHQLHCLNTLRKSSWPEHYPQPNLSHQKLSRDHLDHCIEILRISLMCTADTTPITSQWISPTHAEPDFSTLHTCRNFSKILDFAQSHAERWGH